MCKRIKMVCKVPVIFLTGVVLCIFNRCQAQGFEKKQKKEKKTNNI